MSEFVCNVIYVMYVIYIIYVMYEMYAIYVCTMYLMYVLYIWYCICNIVYVIVLGNMVSNPAITHWSQAVRKNTT